jgi:hypothetical protein
MKTSKRLFIAALLLGIILSWTGFSKKAFANGPNCLEMKIESIKPLKMQKQDPVPETMPLDIQSPLEVAGLGPQPEPLDSPSLQSLKTNPLRKRLIKPQPEPPNDSRAGTPMPIPPSSPALVSNSSNKGSVNPQPEPSCEGYFMSLYKGEASNYGKIPR